MSRLIRMMSAIAFGYGMALMTGAQALARAGGGQGYGGGGGGGDFGGGGGLWGLWPLLFFGHGSGFTGLIVLLIIFYIYRQMQARGTRSRLSAASVSDGGSGGGSSAAAALPVVADEQTIAAGLTAIKQRDPNFDERTFLDRAQTAFFKLQQAWTARNQDLARDVLSDALYERHKMQTDQLIANHQIDVLENIVIGHARVVDVTPGGPYDSITVAFTASMSDYTIDEQSKRIVQGDRAPQTFTEFWTFIRRADAKTAAGQTALQPTCPACGAPLKLADGKCEYCGAPVRTSSADWVVDTIEQST